MEFTIKKLEKSTLIGKGKTFSMTEDLFEKINNFWGELNEDGTLCELMKCTNGKISGLVGLNTNANCDGENTFDYVVCVSSDEKKENYDSYEIDEQEYAVFPVTMETLSDTWQNIHTSGVEGYEILFSKPMLEIYETENVGAIYIPVKNINKIVESRCGLLCSKCEYKEKFNCDGCINIDKPFWADKCPIKDCCESKKHSHCGQCEDFPCDILNKFSYDEEQGDNGKRIEQCKCWKN